MAFLDTNENFLVKVTVALRALGHDVLTSQEAGQANQAIADAEVLRFATAQGRALLTINRRDFIRLHRLSPVHAGIVVCTQDPDTKGQAERIHEAIRAGDSLIGQLVRVHRPSE
ncbi:MAG: hypothetical protein CVU38_14440 [Chloroflexi bacterium HGW-Chloroflexi-1]|nr:MAG: hypothetical protein CVU38_14440 [Chloroflexi bacterium HGW-Chloroflexi-1]